MKNVILLSLLFVLLVSNYSAAFTAIDSLKQRIEHLENERDNLRESFENKKEQLANYTGEKIIRAESELKDKFWYINLFFSILSTMSFGAIVVWCYNRNKWIKRKLAELFETELVDNRKILMEFIEKKDNEIQYKEKYRIVVINAAKKDGTSLLYLLKEWGFQKICKGDLSGGKLDADVIILNYSTIHLPEKKDPDGTTPVDKLPLDETEIENAKKCFPETAVVLYLGPDHVKAFNNLHYRAWANTESQLYGNLMNALHYRDAMVKAKK